MPDRGKARSTEPREKPAGARVLAPATVFAEGREMRYLQGGWGHRVVLLAPEEWSRELARVLLPRFRVIVPHAPGPARGGDATWLRGFLDGIGTRPVHFVTTADHLESVSRFIAFDPDRVRSVAVLRMPDDPPEEEGSLARLRGGTIPILVLPWNPLDGSASSAGEGGLVEFLEDRRSG